MGYREELEAAFEHVTSFGTGTWDERLVFHHVFVIPREMYYGKYCNGITAKPTGAPLGNGGYRR